MADLHHLLEARIRDYHQRKAKGELRPAPEGGQAAGKQSLEGALLGEAQELRRQAESETREGAKAELLEQARRREIQLSVLLERSGRPLAARLLAERLASMPEEDDD